MLGFTLDVQPQQKKPVRSRFVVPKRRQPRNEPYAIAGVEPAIEEILSDPIACALMRCDGVSEATLRTLLTSVRTSLRVGVREPAAADPGQ
ncbi:hypothetical protein DF3PA_90005 [Candidatus Defluviicoccus seviourii]|uniref:Uncharacterized protein n=1 Tax=Candidatus Defluviicoccus seviourii TaxID=2565273 RepID=A0A564WJ35_9PROT|nr:hypothetical protein DF3PA_90005 [Candidatus Defluviicoccus seviourii]